MKDCIIIGAGTYGQVYFEYLKNDYNIKGFYDDDVVLHGTKIGDIEVKGGMKDALEKESNCAVFVPVGNNPVRVRILREFEKKGFDVPSFIHPKTIIHESVTFGKAVYILPGTNIMPCTNIGDYVMISMGVNIAHHTTIEDGCFFSQGTNIGASINIKELAYVGISATLVTGMKVLGKNTLIGAGAVVLKDVPDNAVMAGVPAKVLRYKE